MRTIKSRLVFLIASAAVAPLLAYGWVSVTSLRTGTRQSVIAGNQHVADRAAEQIQLYVDSNVKILRSLGDNLRSTALEPWQQDRMLKNYAIDFPEVREITLFDARGATLATSRIGLPQVAVPQADAMDGRQLYISPIAVDNDLLPTTTIAVLVSSSPSVDSDTAWLVGELNLEEMWRMVDRIRVGREGFALVAERDGKLIAHGNPDEKPRVARGENLLEHPLVREIRATGTSTPAEVEYQDENGRDLLAVGAPLEQLGWTVIVEQPTREAYALALRLEQQLFAVIVTALVVTIVVGFLWGRSLIRPILALMRGTRALAEGRLEERVEILSNDEFRQLGDAFNHMADRLIELQENIRRQERHAMFGRVASGLVHDLAHPLQNIGNSCTLMLRMFDDHEYRESFKRTVDRELSAVKRVMDDLRHLARPTPLQRVPLDVNRSVFDVVESMRPAAEAAGVSLFAAAAPEPLVIEADPAALGRLYRNLLSNAIQATPAGGRVVVTTVDREERVHVSVADTGCGIPAERLPAIFDDFVTTKRRGLGLGLAISKKLVEQLDGRISVSSEVGKGTTFEIDFPKVSVHSHRTALAG